MIDNSLLAFAAILTPIFVAILAHLIAKIPKIGNGLAKFLCVITAYATFLMILMLTHIVTEKGIVVGSIFTISLPIGNFALSMHVDYLALIPTLFFALFASLAITYSIKYLSPENRYRFVPATFNRAYSFMLLFLGSLVGGCFSSNMLAFLIFWEMTSICSYVLVGIWHEDAACRAASIKTFIMLHVGTFGLLIGAIAIYQVVGTWEMQNWNQSVLSHPAIPLSILLFFIGILPKAVQFPLHTWLPDATVTATPITVYVHAGFLMGLYAIPRFFGQIFAPYIATAEVLPSQLSMLFGNINVWSFIISFTGALTSIIAAFFGLLEDESKRVVAYCHVSALGGTVMSLGFATPLGLAAGMLSMIYHVLFIALIFLALGGAIFRVGKTSMKYMGGLSNYMPVTTICGSLGALSMSGFPVLGYFTAVWLAIHAALELNAPVFAFSLFLGSVLKTAAILRLLHGVFFSKLQEYPRKITEAPTLMLFPMGALSACLLVFGVFPQLLLSRLVLPAISQLKPLSGSELTAAFNNIATVSGSLNITEASILISLCLGVIIIGIYISKKSVAHIKKFHIKEESLKPFICGEDVDLLDGARAYHFYHALTHVLRIDRLCHILDIDRLYNLFSKSFFKFCGKLRRFDIRQNYFAAFASFIVGAIIIVLVAVLGG